MTCVYCGNPSDIPNPNCYCREVKPLVTLQYTTSATIENPGKWHSWIKAIQEAHQTAADEDGGMHIAGVEILLAYEHGATVDDCMMRMFV